MNVGILGEDFFREVKESPFFDKKFSVVIDVYMHFYVFHRFTIPVDDKIWRDKNILFNYLSNGNPSEATYGYYFTNYEGDKDDLTINMESLSI